MIRYERGGYARWKNDENIRSQKVDLFTLGDIHECTMIQNHYLNLIEEEILNRFELFDKKMCLERGVPYCTQRKYERGNGEIIIIEADKTVWDCKLTPEIARRELLGLLSECKDWELQTTFVQRVEAYLIVKILEVDKEIQYDISHKHLNNIGILMAIKNVYEEQLKHYAKLYKQRIHNARYEKREVDSRHEKDEFGKFVDDRKEEFFLRSRPDICSC